MSRLSSLTLLAVALALVASACSNPRCPKRYVQRGDTCKVCPEGSAPKDNECVLVDGGQVVEPIDGDGGENAEDEDARDGSASDGGTHDARTPNNDADTTSGNDSSRDPTTVDATATSEDASQSTDASSAEASIPAADGGSDASVDAGPPCYADKDKDGVGAGQPVSCEGYGTDAGAGLSLTNTDCDDNNDKRSPSLTDVCGDNIDNDCDGTPDDESNNACGGPCTVQLAHQPGEKCDNGLFGACARQGKWECLGMVAIACNAPSIAKKSEVCGDGVDNDCDGEADEADAVDATTWYEDCDGDGFSGLTDSLIGAKIGVKTACVMPIFSATCQGWTAVRPQAPHDSVPSSNWDCDDTSAAYKPGAQFGLPPVGHSNTDLNCDGTSEKEPAISWCSPGCGVLVPLKLCSAASGCASCEAAGGSGQWLADDKKTPTDVAPPCSVAMSDTRPWRSIEWPNGVGVCPSNLYNSSWYGGWQRCR